MLSCSKENINQEVEAANVFATAESQALEVLAYKAAIIVYSLHY